MIEIAKRNFKQEPNLGTAMEYLISLIRADRPFDLSEFPHDILMNRRFREILKQSKNISYYGTNIDDYKKFREAGRHEEGLFVGTVSAIGVKIIGKKRFICIYFSYFSNLKILKTKIYTDDEYPSHHTVNLKDCEYQESIYSGHKKNILENAYINSFAIIWEPHFMEKYNWMIMDLDKEIIPEDQLPSRPAWSLPDYGDPYYPWGEDTCPHIHINKEDHGVESVHYFGTVEGAEKEVDKINNLETDLPIRLV